MSDYLLHEALVRAEQAVPVVSEPISPPKPRKRLPPIRLRVLGITLGLGAGFVDSTAPQAATAHQNTEPIAAVQAPAADLPEAGCEPPLTLDFKHVPFYEEGTPELQPGLIGHTLAELGVGQVATAQTLHADS